MAARFGEKERKSGCLSGVKGKSRKALGGETLRGTERLLKFPLWDGVTVI